MSEVEVFDGKLIGLVAGMTNESCQLYERKECLKRATICIFKCSSLLRRIYFFEIFLFTRHVRLVSLFDYRLMQLLFQTGVLDATLLLYHLPK